jgi:hypothetical protein
MPSCFVHVPILCDERWQADCDRQISIVLEARSHCENAAHVGFKATEKTGIETSARPRQSETSGLDGLSERDRGARIELNELQ